MELAGALERKVVSRVDGRFDNTMDFLRAPVREPNVLGHERGVQEAVYRRLQSIGLPAEMWDLDLDALKKHPSCGQRRSSCWTPGRASRTAHGLSRNAG